MSAMAEHWECTIKERLVQNAMNVGLSKELTTEIARHDVGILNNLLEHARREAWQEGHDTALINGQSENPYLKTKEKPEMSDNRITGPAAIRAINALLEDHYMITTSWGEEQCATCFENGGAIGAVEAEWPCDVYTTIQDAKEDQK